MERKIPTKEELEDLRKNKQLSYEEIAQIYNCSTSYIFKFLKLYNIKKFDKPSKEELIKLYHDEDKSSEEIAEIYKCSESVINRLINCYKIDRKLNQYKFDDYKDKTIYGWVILELQEFINSSGKKYTKWLSKCRCGNLRAVYPHNIITGRQRTCGECPKDLISIGLYHKIRQEAESREIKFDITKEYITDLWNRQNSICALSKKEMYLPKEHSLQTRPQCTASLDRIDSDKGYIKGNLQWVTKNMNIMKMDMKQDDFIRECKAVAENFKDYEPKQINVTVVGACGFIGSTLCGILLNKGYKVKAVDNFFKNNNGDALLGYISNDNFEFLNADITNIEDCKKIVENSDVILHLAAVVGAPACHRIPEISRLINVEGTRNLVKAKDKNTKLIFTSTGSVYGKIENICDENSPCNPKSEYGIQKLEAENIILEHENVLVYRYATCFGVSRSMRVNLLINELVYRACTEKAFMVFEADARRTFIHIQDFCNALVYGLDNYEYMTDTDKPIYNIGSNKLNKTKRDIANIIKEKTNCYVHFNDYNSDPDQRDYEVSYIKAFNKGFDTTISIEEGIDELIKASPLLYIKHQYM